MFQVIQINVRQQSRKSCSEAMGANCRPVQAIGSFQEKSGVSNERRRTNLELCQATFI